MTTLRVLAKRIAALWRRDDTDTDLRDELESLAAIERDERLASGASPDDVRRDVLARAGSVTSVQEVVRRRRTFGWLDDLARDARFGARGLRRQPLFAVVAIVSLALGIGANTAIFSLLDRLMLRTLPVHEPEQLAVLSEGTLESRAWTFETWSQLRTYEPLIAGMAAWSMPTPRGVTVDNITMRSSVTMVSGTYFDVLGVRAAIGRALGSLDDSVATVARTPVAVISHRYWQSRFHGAPGVLGETITIDLKPFTIVGVMPAGFDGVQVGTTFDVAVPIAAEAVLHHGESRLESTANWWLQVLLRLKPGQTADAASAALRGIQPLIRQATLPPGALVAEHLATPFAVTPIAKGLSSLRGTYATPLRVLMVAVALVLVIACANLASLLLARTHARRAEMALRRSLGASRSRIVSQMLVESLLLTGIGAVLGTLLARWAARFIVWQLETPVMNVPIALDVDIDGRMIAFSLAVAGTTAVLVGAGPALHATRTAPGEALKDQPRTTIGRPQQRGGLWLVGLQVALSFVLLAGAGLLVQSLVGLLGNVGHIDMDRVVIARVSVTPGTMGPADEAILVDRLRDAARAIPGVASVAVSSLTPAQPAVSLTGIAAVGGVPVAGAPRERMAFVNSISPDYFSTFGTPFHAGRDFTTADAEPEALVAIVNRAFVRRFLGDHVQPIGVPITRLATGPGGPAPELQIVGVVEDATISPWMQAPSAILYLPMRRPSPGDTRVPASRQISVRAAGGDPRLLLRPLTDALTRVSPFVAVDTYTLDAQVLGLLTRDRLLASLTSALAGLALVLTAVGLYGVIAYATTQRRREIGVRTALGATPAAIIRLVITRAAVVVAVGLVAGIALTLWTGRFIESLLFGLAPRDPGTLVGVGGVLLATGAIAALLPAWRAARTSPAIALRQ